MGKMAPRSRLETLRKSAEKHPQLIGPGVLRLLGVDLRRCGRYVWESCGKATRGRVRAFLGLGRVVIAPRTKTRQRG